MEQRIAGLEKALTQITQAFTTLAGKVKEQHAKIEELTAKLEALDKKPSATTDKPRTSRKRRPKNYGDWQKVVACLNNGMTNWREISNETDIPESTCRSYGKLTEAEGNALPVIDDEPEEKTDDDDGLVSTGVVDPTDGKEVMKLATQQPVTQQPVTQQPVVQQTAPTESVATSQLNDAVAELLADSDELINREF